MMVVKTLRHPLWPQVIIAALMFSALAFAAPKPTSMQLAKALQQHNPPDKTVIKQYLNAGGDPNVCIPVLSGPMKGTCENLTMMLAYPNTEDLALLAISKGGLNTHKLRQKVFEFTLQEGLTKIVKKLTALGADYNGSKNAIVPVPVAFAAAKNDFPTVKVLVQAGANVNKVGALGSTALGNALGHGNEHMALYLVHHGASLVLNQQGGVTLLYAAAAAGSTKFVTALTALGFDVNVQDKYGYTPLINAITSPYASTAARAQIIKTLLHYGAKTCHREKEKGRTALDYARQFNRKKAIKILAPVSKHCKEKKHEANK